MAFNRSRIFSIVAFSLLSNAGLSQALPYKPKDSAHSKGLTEIPSNSLDKAESKARPAGETKQKNSLQDTPENVPSKSHQNSEGNSLPASQSIENSPTQAQSNERCPKSDLAGIKKAYRGRGEMNLIFFSSWCASCKPHLKSDLASNEILIVAFDEQKPAEKVLKNLSITAPCFTSEGITEELGIESVPNTRKINF